jgi:hypothetical protein
MQGIEPGAAGRLDDIYRISISFSAPHVLRVQTGNGQPSFPVSQTGEECDRLPDLNLRP